MTTARAADAARTRAADGDEEGGDGAVAQLSGSAAGGVTAYYTGRGVTLHLGDARQTSFAADVLLTDPPYGLKIGKQAWHGNNGRTRLVGENSWDGKTYPETINRYVAVCSDAIVWGGNFYPLPPSRCWLVWDKLQPNRGAECELAWTNLNKPPAVFRMSRIDAYFNRAVFKKVHPTEKPIGLFRWCLERTQGSVVDPFCGVGTTLLAARLMGRSAIGVDLNEAYLEEAARRLETTEHLSPDEWAEGAK